MTPDTDVVLSLARLAAQAAAAKTDEPTVVLDVGDVLAITNYFVITGGRNRPPGAHGRRGGRGPGRRRRRPRPLRVEGLDSLRWVLLDYGDFVVHVLLDEARPYYELERLWSDVPRIDVGRAASTRARHRPAPERRSLDRAGRRQPVPVVERCARRPYWPRLCGSGCSS